MPPLKEPWQNSGIYLTAVARFGQESVDSFVAKYGAEAEARLRVVLQLDGKKHANNSPRIQKPAQEFQKSAQESVKNSEKRSRIPQESRIPAQEFSARQTGPWKMRSRIRTRIPDESTFKNRMAEFGASCRALPSGSPQQLSYLYK